MVLSFHALPLFCSLFSAVGPGDTNPAALDLRTGARIVLLGDGLIEQERRFGHLETRLRRRWPDAPVVVRNLGWAGDTVRGNARTGGFQNPDGFARLLKEVHDYKPTVLFIAYGTNESFDGPGGLPGFRTAYAQLLAKLAPLKARLILVSPTFQEDLGRPFPDPAQHNQDLEKYVAAIRELAKEHKGAFVDLFHPFAPANKDRPKQRLTTNGLQLNEAGSAFAAHLMEEQLGLAPRVWRAELDATGKLSVAMGVQIDKVTAVDDRLHFLATDHMLAAKGEAHFLKMAGLPAGRYALKMDKKQIHLASAEDWQRGIAITDSALWADTENLRQAIVVNNDLFYRRWRPFNDHSRHWGFIGGDGKLYDQEMATQEKNIATQARPRLHLWEIVRVEEGQR